MYDASLFEATVQILQQSVQYLKELSERMRVSFNAHLDVRVLVIMRSRMIMCNVQSDLGFRQAFPEQCHVLVSSDQSNQYFDTCAVHVLGTAVLHNVEAPITLGKRSVHTEETAPSL